MSEEVKEINLPKEIEEAFNCIDYELSVCNDELSKILDYITNLQYKYENQLHRYKNLKDYATNLQEENEELKEQKKKAIEYIKRELKEFYNRNKNCKYLGEILELESIEEILGGDE